MFPIRSNAKTARTAGFTLIELMVVIVILGVLAALALPAFMTYVTRSRTGEVPPVLKGIFMSAASYYRLELTTRGVSSDPVNSCISGPAVSAWTPSPTKHAWEPVTGSGFRTIGFNMPSPVYFRYELDTYGLPSTCDMPPNNPALYAARAYGDLDGDGTLSTFELAVGTDSNNSLYRGVGIWSDNELE